MLTNKFFQEEAASVNLLKLAIQYSASATLFGLIYLLSLVGEKMAGNKPLEVEDMGLIVKLDQKTNPPRLPYT